MQEARMDGRGCELWRPTELEQKQRGDPLNMVEVQNWKRAITYHAHSVEAIGSDEDIRRIVKDPTRYPSPVRVKESHHSTTRCVVAEGGTVLDVSGFNRILSIDKEKCQLTMQADVLYIGAAKELDRNDLQFYVNVEIGNLTVVSGACGGTKDASYFSKAEGWEFGQVASFTSESKLCNPTAHFLKLPRMATLS